MVFASATPKNQQLVIASALACADTPKDSVMPTSAVPKELEELCTVNGTAVPDFLEAILEYQKLISPTDETRLALSLEASVKMLEELNLEIDKKKVEIRRLNQQINATRRELNSAYKVLDGFGPGNVSLLAVVQGMGLLSNEAVNRLAASNEEVEYTKTMKQWLDSLPHNLFLNNLQTIWHELQPTLGMSYLQELLGMEGHTADSLLVTAVGAAVLGELMEDDAKMVDLHMNLCTAQPSYQEAYFGALALDD